MPDKQTDDHSRRIERLVRRLEDQPEIVESLERVLQLIENETGETITADQAEELLIREMRRMGLEAMGGWARRKENRLAQEYGERRGLVKREKKS